MTMQADSNTLQNDVFARLRMGIQQFPTQQKTICSYILNNHQKVAFYTVEELGRASDTSPATVVRVVKRLGYDSYKELLEDLQKVMMHGNNAVWWELEQIWNTNESDSEQEPVLSWVLRDDIEGIKRSLTPQLIDSFDKAIDMMEKAKNIGLVGMRSSKFVAGFMHYMMNQFFSNTKMINSNGSDMIYDDVLNYGANDLGVAVSIGGPHYVKTTHEILKFLKENSVPSILITNDIANPAIDSATLALCVDRTKYHYSIVQPLALVEALVTELARKKKGVAKKKLSRLNEILDSKGITM